MKQANAYRVTFTFNATYDRNGNVLDDVPTTLQRVRRRTLELLPTERVDLDTYRDEVARSNVVRLTAVIPADKYHPAKIHTHAQLIRETFRQDEVYIDMVRVYFETITADSEAAADEPQSPKN